jgi:CheY-like chemotaxis protein
LPGDRTVPKNILIVDDEPKVRFFLKESLESLGSDYAVSPVASAEDALAALAHAPYDLVVTDLRMPGMNGLDLLSRVRHDRPLMPTILITAYGSDEVAAESRRLQTTRYFTKPFRIEDFLQAVQEALVDPVPEPYLPAIPADKLERLVQRLQDLRFEAGAQGVLLADISGRLLAEVGSDDGLEPAVLVEIVSHSIDSSLELVQHMREERASNLVYHEGVRFDLYSANIDQQLFIVLVFDRRQGLNRIGVVWLYTKRAIQELQSILAN